MVITVRKAVKADMSIVLEMINELAAFQQMPDEPKLTLNDLHHDGGFDESSEPAKFSCFVAEDIEAHQISLKSTENATTSKTAETVNRSALIGYALSYYAYSSWLGKTLFLEDLYVRPSHRFHGVGKQIFTEVVKFANLTDCKRVYFQMMDGNPANEFYLKMKAVNLTASEGWQFYCLHKDEIDLY